MAFVRSFKTFTYSTVLTILILFTLTIGSAQVRTSSNYQLQSDSINAGGGLSSSTSYVQESTVGEIATGESDSTSYSLRAGYQQMHEGFISLAVSGNVSMTPSLQGITGGQSNGSTTLTVVTDSPSGYQMTIKAEGSPAMQRDGGGASIADYNEGTDPDFSFTTGSSDSHLGFTPDGNDVAQYFLDDGGGLCNAGSGNVSLACWAGLSTSNRVFASATSPNHPNGATTTLNFRVGIGGGAGVLSGVYTATTTVTALPL